MTLWTITLHPDPRTGGDASAVLARLLASSESTEPPAFAFVLSAAIALDLLTDEQGGITSTVERIEGEAPAEPPDWTADGVRIWRG